MSQCSKCNDQDWITAANKDRNYISKYARDSPVNVGKVIPGEDFAESILPWIAITFRPNRIKGNTSAIRNKVINKVNETIPNRIIFLNKHLKQKLFFT